MVFDGTSTLTEEKKVKTEWAVSIGRQEGGSCIVHMHLFKGYVWSPHSYDGQTTELNSIFPLRGATHHFLRCGAIERIMNHSTCPCGVSPLPNIKESST